MEQAGTFEMLGQGRASSLSDWDELVNRSYAGTRLEAERPSCSGRLDRLRLGEIRVARIMAAPHWVWRWYQGAPSRPLGVTYLHVQESGRSITRQRGQATELSGGMAAFCDPNENYSVQFPETYSVYLVEIPDLLLTQGSTRAIPSGAIVPGRAGLLHGLLAQIFRQMTYLCDDPDWAEGVHGALASLVRHLAPIDGEVRPATGVSHGLREAVLQMVQRRLTDPDLSVGTLAQGLGINRRSVQRVFAGSHGSASAYILERRLRMAAQRLASGAQRETITCVAMACGFADAAHFARCFRARFGRTPSAFRHALSAADDVIPARRACPIHPD